MPLLINLILSIGSFLATRLGQIVTVSVIAAAIYTHFMEIINRIEATIAMADAAVAPSLAGATGLNIAPLGLINYVLPVDIMIAMLLAYIPFYALCAGIRLVKSFVPTIS